MDNPGASAIRSDLKWCLLEQLLLRQQITLSLLKPDTSVQESLSLSLSLMDEIASGTDRMVSQAYFDKFHDAQRAFIADELRDIVDDWKEQLKRIAADMTVAPRTSRPPFE